MSHTEKQTSGWLNHYLIPIESMFSGRWLYWSECLNRGELLPEPIPQISFHDTAPAAPLKNLMDCLSQRQYSGCRLDNFMQWILHGFGAKPWPEGVEEKLTDFWYETFDMGLLLKEPHDYWGHLLSEAKQGCSYWNNPNAFYPTPHAVCETMVKMQFSDQEDKDMRHKTVCDPCVGSGRMLLFASNYSLRLFGQDIDQQALDACMLNGYLYAPWLVKPFPEKFFNKKGDQKMLEGEIRMYCESCKTEVMTLTGQISEVTAMSLPERFQFDARLDKGNNEIRVTVCPACSEYSEQEVKEAEEAGKEEGKEEAEEEAKENKKQAMTTDVASLERVSKKIFDTLLKYRDNKTLTVLSKKELSLDLCQVLEGLNKIIEDYEGDPIEMDNKTRNHFDKLKKELSNKK